MLVLLNVEVSRGSPAFNVWVRKFGAQAILDVQVDSARFARVPTPNSRLSIVSGRR
jgi:hypothetical protein